MLTFRNGLQHCLAWGFPAALLFGAGMQRSPGAHHHSTLLFCGILEDSREDLGLFTPLLGRYFECCPEDTNSWAVKVSRLQLPHTDQTVIIANVKYAFCYLDFQGGANSRKGQSQS